MVDESPVGSVLTIAVTKRERRWCPLTPRHASQDSCCRSNFGQVDGSFFCSQKTRDCSCKRVVRRRCVAVVQEPESGGLRAYIYIYIYVYRIRSRVDSPNV